MYSRRLVKTIITVVCVVFLTTSIATAGQDKVKMSFTDAPVGLVLQALGKLTGSSFTISSQAANKLVSIEMDDVPFDVALEMIAQAGGVTINKVGANRYVVYGKEETGDSVKSEKQREIEATEEFLSQSVMEVVPVKYVSVEDVESAVNSTIGNGSDSVVKVTKLENGTDRSFRSVVVYAASQRVLDMVKKVIKQIDVPKPMVEIEILFAEVSLNNNKNAGLTWNPMTNPITFTENNDGLGVFTLGSFTRSAISMEAALTATFGSNKAKVLACPKLRTMSGYKAVFKSETEQPIPEKDDDGNWSVTWKDVGISLEVLPVVMADGSIQMSVHPKASNVTSFVTQGDITAPVISKRETETQVFLEPGEIMVISGLINDSEIRNMSKVPILGDIPLLGELFKNHENKKERSNVIVMLRPKLVDAPSMKARDVDKKIEEWKKSLQRTSVSEEAKEKKDVDADAILEKWKKEVKPVSQEQSIEPQKQVQTDKPNLQQEKPKEKPVETEQVGKPKGIAETEKMKLEKKFQELVNQYKDKPVNYEPASKDTQVVSDSNEDKQPAQTPSEDSTNENTSKEGNNQKEQKKPKQPAADTDEQSSTDTQKGGSSSEGWVPPLE